MFFLAITATHTASDHAGSLSPEQCTVCTAGTTTAAVAGATQLHHCRLSGITLLYTLLFLVKHVSSSRQPYCLCQIDIRSCALRKLLIQSGSICSYNLTSNLAVNCYSLHTVTILLFLKYLININK